MRKTIVYRKKDKKITMVCDSSITINDRLVKKEINITPIKWKELKNKSARAYYDRGIKYRRLPEDDLADKKKAIIDKLKDKDTTLDDLKTEIIKLINI